MEKQNFKNQQVICYTQEGTLIAANSCLTGILAKTANGFRFEEEVKTTKPHTRNPKIFEMRHISVVRRADNSLKFSFKELRGNFNPEQFAQEVFLEIVQAINAINQ